MNPLYLLAVVFGVLAGIDLVKPLLPFGETGVVFLGKRLSGAPSLIAGWTFAAFFGGYARALWGRADAALPLGLGYAGYASANLHYTLVDALYAPHVNVQAAQFAPYAAAAFTLAWGAVLVMWRSGVGRRDQTPGRIPLRAMALLFALMAVSNALKPFVYASDVGFVFFGRRLEGTANTLVALCFSGFLATYAASLWAERRYALVLAALYAVYVPVNIVMWNAGNPDPDDMPMLMALPYLAAAIGVSSGAALLLWRQRNRLT